MPSVASALDGTSYRLACTSTTEQRLMSNFNMLHFEVGQSGNCTFDTAVSGIMIPPTVFDAGAIFSTRIRFRSGTICLADGMFVLFLLTQECLRYAVSRDPQERKQAHRNTDDDQHELSS